MNYEYLEKIVHERVDKKMEFYKQIGVSAEGFRGMMANKTMKVSTLEKISEFLAIPLPKFFNYTDNNIISEPNTPYNNSMNYKDKYLSALENTNALQQKHILLQEKHIGILEQLNACHSEKDMLRKQLTDKANS